MSRDVFPPENKEMFGDGLRVAVEGEKGGGGDGEMSSEEELDLAKEDANKGGLEGGEVVEEERVGEEGVNRLAEDGL